MPKKPVLAVALSLNLLASTQAADWPQFLGPSRNGACEGPILALDWGTNGPPMVWKTPVGHGFSGPVVAERKVILFHRRADEEQVDCLDARTGSRIWHFAYPTKYQDEFGFDDGPRATPVVSDHRVYTFGAEGSLHCLDLMTGTNLWSADLQKDFRPPNGFFGLACSPLIEGEALLLNLGAPNGAGIVAFHKTSGKLLWKNSEDEASYSSPTAATIEARRYVVFFTRNGLVAADPVTGNIGFQYSWHSQNRMSVNAATPLVFGNTIFLSASYGTGAILLRSHDHQLEKLWSGDDLLSNHYATSVEYKGFLFGIHGRTDPGYRPSAALRCVNLNTKKVCWESDTVGAATLTRVGERLLILTEKGELIQIVATPDQFLPKSRAQIFPNLVRAFPAVADGFFYARGQDRLICLDLGKANHE